MCGSRWPFFWNELRAACRVACPVGLDANARRKAGLFGLLACAGLTLRAVKWLSVSNVLGFGAVLIGGLLGGVLVLFLVGWPIIMQLISSYDP
jgi:hypothetical protein